MPKGNPGVSKVRLKRRFCGKGHDTLICGRAPNRQCNICRAAEKSKRDGEVSAEALAKRRKWRQAWREKNRVRLQNDSWRKQGIKNRSGSDFTYTDYTLALIMAGNRCEACGTSGVYLKKKLAPDHDHKTGMFRGLLCGNCNMAIGYLGDDPERIAQCLEYLNSFSKSGTELAGTNAA